ncbi:hypothetical protein Tco_0435141 [Tanacetum coccineum]
MLRANSRINTVLVGFKRLQDILRVTAAQAPRVEQDREPAEEGPTNFALMAYTSLAAVSVNTARPINNSYTRPTVNSARTASNVLNRAHTHVRRPFNKSTTNKNSNLKEKVNTIKGDVTTAGPKVVVSDNKGNEANAIKASACWVWRPKQKVLDHVSRHIGASMNFKRFGYDDHKGKTKNVTNMISDIDALTISINYKPIVARNQTNGNTGTKENIDVGQARKKIVPDQEFNTTTIDVNVNITNNINTVNPAVSAADIENNVVDENIVYGGAWCTKKKNEEEKTTDEACLVAQAPDNDLWINLAPDELNKDSG